MRSLCPPKRCHNYPADQGKVGELVVGSGKGGVTNEVGEGGVNYSDSAGWIVDLKILEV